MASRGSGDKGRGGAEEEEEEGKFVRLLQELGKGWALLFMLLNSLE